MIWLDSIIYYALKKRMKVELFLCRDEEGGFGVKINGKHISRNHPWETFEYEEDGSNNPNIKKLYKLYIQNKEPTR